VIIVADAFTIATRPRIEAEMLTSSTYVYNLLNNYKFKEAERGEGMTDGITIALVLTKADILPPEWKENNYQKLFEQAREVFRGVVDFAEEQRAQVSSLRPWLYPAAMIPVSVAGEGNASVVDPGTGYELATVSLDGAPEPVNIHYPFLYAIGNELDRSALYMEEQEEELEARGAVGPAPAQPGEGVHGDGCVGEGVRGHAGGVPEGEQQGGLAEHADPRAGRDRADA